MLPRLPLSWREFRLVFTCRGGAGIAQCRLGRRLAGVIQGIVADAQGGVLPGVTLTLRNTETGVVRTTVSESDGQYRFAGLQPAVYDLKAELPGFATVAVDRLTVTIGAQLKQDIKMQVQSLQETVTVSGVAPVIEVTRTEVAQVITQEQIDTLPMADRQPASLVLLLPGTNMDNTQVRRAQANIGAGGINNQMNAYFLDGSANWSTNSGPAARGNAAARDPRIPRERRPGVGRAWRQRRRPGQHRHEERNEPLQRRGARVLQEPVDAGAGQERGGCRRARSPTTSATSGASRSADRSSRTRSTSTARSSTRRRTSRSPSTAGSRSSTASSKACSRPTTCGASISCAATCSSRKSQSLFVRYGRDCEHIDCEGCGGTNAAFSQTYVESPRDTNVIGHTWVISSRSLNELRVQYPARLRNTTGPPGTALWATPGRVPRRAVRRLHAGLQLPEHALGIDHRQPQLDEPVRAQGRLRIPRGNHQWKFGGATRNTSHRRTSSPTSGPGRSATDQFFDGSAAAIANLRNPTTFTASFPNVVRRLENYWINGYGQDEWKHPQQPDAEPGRPLRPAVPLVQQPVRLHGARVAQAA